MQNITYAIALCALSSAVYLNNWLLVQRVHAEIIEITGFQPTEESQASIAGEDQAIPQPQFQPQSQWVVDPNSTAVYVPMESVEANHTEIHFEFDSTQQSTIFQTSVPPDFIPQTTDMAGVSEWPATQPQAGIFLKDVGYNGPGDMRTHLWRDHSSDLEENGISHETLMSMPIESVQKWHNYFHGTEHAPDSPEPHAEMTAPASEEAPYLSH